ncbi:DUF4350 domain-containing protein [Demequina sp. SYSU T00068]|uniref:DUF4350 domain-containing protein n=1 Tax=Demequina lignilytica TaxID=3051663 RepID=UPI00261ECEFB|nr:DUF4350 domain-containing protein [Demequina sp. SYSU T00068]MDN4490178.1 DUF4350 domain-containing protein [Demequina sp. SYSU T00068]
MSVGRESLVTTDPGPGIAARARGGRPWLVAVVLLAAIVALLVVTSRPSDYTPLSTENSTDTGTRALAQILRQHHVEVTQIDRLSRAGIADPAATTVVVANPELLTSGQLGSLADYPGDLVLLGADDSAFAALGLPVETALGFLPEVADAACQDPDAVAAGEVRVDHLGVRATAGGDVTVCFAQRDGAGAMARVEDGARTLTVIASTGLVTNGRLADLGHAALALRVTGRHPDVVWYVADGFDPTLLTWAGDDAGGGSGDGGVGRETLSELEASPDFLPPGTGTALYALGLALVFAAIWRGRRFGALVREPMPVVVRSSEATRGRARLYRRARATGRSAAALRAATATRIARRIGVPRTAGRADLVESIRRATGRSTAEIEALLYGAPPADDAALLTLLTALDALESEVHRP